MQRGWGNRGKGTSLRERECQGQERRNDIPEAKIRERYCSFRAAGTVHIVGKEKGEKEGQTEGGKERG